MWHKSEPKMTILTQIIGKQHTKIKENEFYLNHIFVKSRKLYKIADYKVYLLSALCCLNWYTAEIRKGKMH